MDARYFVTLKKFLRMGDRAVVYIHGGKFVAIVEFTSKWYYDDKNLGWTKNKKSYLCPYRINFRVLLETRNPLKISYSTIAKGNKAKWINPNFIDNITFIADKGKTWNQYVQVSIVRITKEDFNIIFREMKKSIKNISKSMIKE